MKSLVLNKQQITNKIKRIAFEILEHNHSAPVIYLAGINGQGLKLAERLAAILSEESDIKIEIIPLNVDKDTPYDKEVELPVDLEDLKNQTVLVIDDVLNSGKTMMYGIKAFLSIPLSKIASVVLVNRAHKRFPIQPDFVGMSLATTLQEHIEVSLEEGNESVYLS